MNETEKIFDYSEEGSNSKMDNSVFGSGDKNVSENSYVPSSSSSAVTAPVHALSSSVGMDLPMKDSILNESATLSSEYQDIPEAEKVVKHSTPATIGAITEDNFAEDILLSTSIDDEDDTVIDESSVDKKSASVLSLTQGSNPKEGKKEARRKRQLRKAKGAPKRFKSAYICYVMENMDEAKKTLTDAVKATEAMKTLAVMWKELSPEAKMEYQKKAESDKIRYYAEMRDYTGPMHVPNKRQKKPAGAPKRAMSAFLSFSQQMRPQVRAKYPGMKNTEISIKLADLWKESTEEEKAPHLSRELKDRGKYHEDMVKWKEEVSQQAEIDAINAAVESKARVAREAERERMGLGMSNIPSVAPDIGFVPSMGNGISSSSSAQGDEFDFFQNIWMDTGWTAVDKLIQDAERDDPVGVMSGNVRQDFFGGKSSGRYNSRDQFLSTPVDPQAFHMRQHPQLPPSYQQQLPPSNLPMIPPLQAQRADANSFLKHEANSLLNYTANAYSTMSNPVSSSSMSSASASSFDWRSMPQGQFMPTNNPFNEHQQQFYSPHDGTLDNRNIFSNNSYNFENFQQHQQQQFLHHHQMQQQQQQEYQRRYQQYHPPHHR